MIKWLNCCSISDRLCLYCPRLLPPGLVWYMHPFINCLHIFWAVDSPQSQRQEGWSVLHCRSPEMGDFNARISQNHTCWDFSDIMALAMAPCSCLCMPNISWPSPTQFFRWLTNTKPPGCTYSRSKHRHLLDGIIVRQWYYGCNDHISNAWCGLLVWPSSVT